MHIYFGTVCNRKDLEPTQMPINYRLNKENVTHIHYGVLCSHKKCPLQGMDKARNHHSQQTDQKTEKQTLHVLIHKWVLNNGHREGNITHQGLSGCGGLGEG